jgi:hypothetical protein
MDSLETYDPSLADIPSMLMKYKINKISSLITILEKAILNLIKFIVY